MAVFESILPLVAIAVFGYSLRRAEILSEPETAALERFTFYFLLPFLLFTGTATAQLPEDLDWRFLLGFYLAVVLVYLAGMALGRLVFRYSLVEQSVFGMGGAYSNVTLVGIPVCLEILGEEAFLPMFVLIAVHNLFLFTFGTVVAEHGGGAEVNLGRRLVMTGRGLVLSPITGSLLAGLAVNLLGIPLYGPLLEAMTMLGRAAVPAALFVLGASIVRYRVRGDLKPTLWMVGLKLLVLPALVWLFMFPVFGVAPLWGGAAVLLAAMPVGVSLFIFSRRYRACETQAAAAIALSSILAVFSISFYAWLLAGPG